MACCFPFSRSKRNSPLADELLDAHQPLTTTTVTAPAPASPLPPLALCAYDTRAWVLSDIVLHSTWFFDQPIDGAALRASLAELLRLFPALAGRASASCVRLTNQGVPFSEQRLAGGAREHLATLEPDAATFCDLRPAAAVRRGAAPLMTARLTHFDDGSAALGVCLPHLLVDGFSFVKLVQLWATLHADGEPTASYTFDRAALRLPPADAVQAAAEGARRMHSLQLRLVRLVTRRSLRRPRARVHLTHAELSRLREGAPRLPCGGRPSSGELLMARLLRLVGGELRPQPASRQVLINMTTNMRGRGGAPRYYLGNLFDMVTNWRQERLSAVPSKCSEAELLDACRAVTDQLRGEAADATVADFLKATALLEHRLYWPAAHGSIFSVISEMRPVFNFNNQISFPSLQIRFGEGSCIGYRPWNCDCVQIVPAAGPGPAADEADEQVLYGRVVRELVGTAETVREAFESLDAKGSGALSPEDLLAALRARRIRMDEARLPGLLAYLTAQPGAHVRLADLEKAYATARLAGGVDIYIRPATFTNTKRSVLAWLQSDAFKQQLLGEEVAAAGGQPPSS